MRRLAATVSAVCLLAGAAHASPAFDNFRRLCAETDGVSAAALAAADKAGWQAPAALPPSVATMRVTGARLSPGGDFILQVGDGLLNGQTIAHSCMVLGRDPAPTLTAEGMGWSGLGDGEQDRAGDGATGAFFSLQGGRRVAIASPEAWAAEVQKGRMRHLQLISTDSTSATYDVFLPSMLKVLEDADKANAK